MKNILKLNTPAVAIKLLVKELDVRPYTSQLSYIDDTKIIKTASEKEPVYRLCKDYENDGVEFSLNMIITDTNAGKAEKFMDKISKKVTSQQASEALSQPWLYLEEKYKEKK